MDWKEVDRRHEAKEQQQRREEAQRAAEEAEAKAKHDSQKAANLQDVAGQTARFLSLMADIGDPDLSRFIFGHDVLNLSRKLNYKSTHLNPSTIRAALDKRHARKALDRTTIDGWDTGDVWLGDHQGAGRAGLVVLQNGQIAFSRLHNHIPDPILEICPDIQEIEPPFEKWLGRPDVPERVADCLVGMLRKYGARIS